MNEDSLCLQGSTILSNSGSTILHSNSSSKLIERAPSTKERKRINVVPFNMRKEHDSRVIIKKHLSSKDNTRIDNKVVQSVEKDGDDEDNDSLYSPMSLSDIPVRRSFNGQSSKNSPDPTRINSSRNTQGLGNGSVEDFEPYLMKFRNSQSRPSTSSKEYANKTDISPTRWRNAVSELNTRDQCALKLGRLFLSSVLMKDEANYSDSLSRFFLDAWLSRSGSHSKNVDASSIEFLSRMQNVLTKLHIESSDAPTSEFQGDVNNTQVMKSTAALGLETLDRIIEEFGKSHPVLQEIRATLLPAIFEDSSAISRDNNNNNNNNNKNHQSEPLQDNDISSAHSGKKYLNHKFWIDSSQEYFLKYQEMADKYSSISNEIEGNRAELQHHKTMHAAELTEKQLILKELKEKTDILDSISMQLYNSKKELASLKSDNEHKLHENGIKMNLLAEESEILRKKNKKLIEEMEKLKQEQLPDIRAEYKIALDEIRSLRKEKETQIRECNSLKTILYNANEEKSAFEDQLQSLFVYIRVLFAKWREKPSSKNTQVVELLHTEETSPIFDTIPSRFEKWISAIAKDLLKCDERYLNECYKNKELQDEKELQDKEYKNIISQMRKDHNEEVNDLYMSQSKNKILFDNEIKNLNDQLCEEKRIQELLNQKIADGKNESLSLSKEIDALNTKHLIETIHMTEKTDQLNEMIAMGVFDTLQIQRVEKELLSCRNKFQEIITGKYVNKNSSNDLKILLSMQLFRFGRK